MNIALLFEQSGTFKKILKSYGHNAKDFDISNDYNETDYIIDLFDYIENTNMVKINKADLVIAFFPCTWFSNQNDLIYRKQLYQFKFWTDDKINQYIKEREEKYEKAKNILLTMVDKIKVPLIVENPNSHRIVEILNPNNSILHKRSKFGDYYDKPTRYFLFNGVKITNLDEIKNPLHFRINYTREMKNTLKGSPKMKRSLIAPEYVENLLSHTYVNGVNLKYGNNK